MIEKSRLKAEIKSQPAITKNEPMKDCRARKGLQAKPDQRIANP
jgi:hypothetical protein